jgi:drug/metabolite transporter (DMT)-like permease
MVSQFTYLTTINYSNSGTATILQYTGLAMILVVVCVMEKRLPKIFETLALLLAMGGIFLIATHGDIKTMVISKECLFWGLFSAVGLVCYSMIPKKLLKEYGSLPASGFGMIIGGIVLSLIIRPWQYAVSFDFGAVMALLGIVVVGTVVAYNLYLMGVNLIGPVKAGMIAAIEPVAAAVFSALFVGTSFTFWDVIGFAFIISTVFISNINKELS